MHMHAAVIFTVIFVTLYAAHHVGDQWVQTHTQACTKGGTGWTARLACARHVLTMTMTKIIAVTVTAVATHLSLSISAAIIAFAIDAASHYWADRRSTLAKIANLIGKNGYYQLGVPRPGHDDNVTTGTGAYHLDQAWHIAFIWITALIIAAG